MAVGKKKGISRLDRNLENLLVFSTGALAANSVRARRQASFTTDLKLAIVAVGIALLLLGVVLFSDATVSAPSSRKDQGPDATDSLKVQSHSAEPVRSQIPITNVSFLSAPESKPRESKADLKSNGVNSIRKADRALSRTRINNLDDQNRNK